MDKRFPTKADALQAGFVSPHDVKIEYRLYKIYSEDISGRSSQGYTYGIAAIPIYYNADFPEGRLPCIDKTFARSQDVWLIEESDCAGHKGMLFVAFHDEDLSKGVASAKAAIDTMYDKNLAARNFEAERQAVREAADRNFERKRKARAQKLATKYGAENLSREWRSLL